MNLLRIFTLTFVVATPVLADGVSSCKSSCFDKKRACNSRKSHTFNSCDHDLFTCKASCNSGNPQQTYTTNIPLDISFHPILDLEK